MKENLVMTAWRPNRLYLLDEDLEIAGAEPIGSTAEAVFFHPESTYRLYPTRRTDNHAPYIDIYIMSNGSPTVQLHFCEDATPTQLSKFWDYVRRKEIIDVLSARWGSVRVEWAISGGHYTPLDPPTIPLYFDDSVGWAYLLLFQADEKTYDDLIEEHSFLTRLFRDANRVGDEE